MSIYGRQYGERLYAILARGLYVVLFSLSPPKTSAIKYASHLPKIRELGPANDRQCKVLEEVKNGDCLSNLTSF